MGVLANGRLVGLQRALRRGGELIFGRGASPLLLVAALIGATAGLLSAGFWDALGALSAAVDLYLVRPLDAALPLGLSWTSWRFVMPAVGGLAAGLGAHALFRTPRRIGVPAVMLDARRQWARIPLRYVPATFVNALLTIGTGGSAGREAPVVAMGGGLGAWAARRLKLPPAQRRLLVGCGAASAIGAAFNAPLAGVFFTLEVILGDWRAGTLAPVMVASVAGTALCRAAEGTAEAHFQVPPYQLASWWEVLVYAGLGVAAGLVGEAFTASLKAIEHRSSRMAAPAWLRPALGGLGVGLLGLALPGVLGNGYPAALAACTASLPWKLMIALVAGKILATALTLGSGGWGGDFAPTLVVGAMTGGVYGLLAASVLGSGVAASGAYAMVGMGAMLAAVVRCPVTSVLLLFELTGSYEVILPIMTAVATAIFVSRRLRRFGLYHQGLRELGGPAFEMWGEQALTSMTVADAMDDNVDTLPEDAPYEVVLRRVEESPHWIFPVVRRDGTMLGVVRLADLRPHLLAAGREIPVVAAELAVENVPLLTRETPLDEAAHLLAVLEWNELPVVESHESARPCGVVYRHEVLRRAVTAAGTTHGG